MSPRARNSLRVRHIYKCVSPRRRSVCRIVANNGPRRKTGPPVAISLVWVIAPNPPDDITPLNWLLLTNVEVSNFSEALQRIEWYTQCWHIEVYFKVLKSGTKVEQQARCPSRALDR